MLKDFLNFDKMISPILIKIVFYILAGIDVLVGLFWLLTGMLAFFTGHGLPGLLMAFFGMVTMVVGPLSIRILCEMAIVVFLIHENLIAIRRSIESPQAAMFSGLNPNMPLSAAPPALPNVAPSYAQPIMRQE